MRFIGYTRSNASNAAAVAPMEEWGKKRLAGRNKKSVYWAQTAKKVRRSRERAAPIEMAIDMHTFTMREFSIISVWAPKADLQARIV